MALTAGGAGRTPKGRGKVLVVAYYFPPTGGGGVQRALKFVKYLPACGFAPVVLTVRNPDLELRDESLLADVSSGVLVYRTWSFDPVRWYRVWRYGRRPRFDMDRPPAGASARAGTLGRMLMPVRMLGRACKSVVNNLLLVPDDYVGWIPFAVAKGAWIIKRERIDVVYATGKPWSAFVIALLLRFLTGTPYVLDLRDPWVITPYGGPTGLRRRLEGWLEQTCFRYAGAVVNINEQITRAYRRCYAWMPADKFACITHGFDPDDFASVTPKRNDGTFRLTFVGTIYSDASPENVLKSLARVAAEEGELHERIRLTLVGFVPEYVTEMVRALGLEQIVEAVGYVAHRESIQYMVDADVLLLLLNNVEVNREAQISRGKLFEYLATRRPILALVPADTDAARLVRALDAGRVVDPDDGHGIATAIRELYALHQARRLTGHAAPLDRFERATLTGELAASLRAAMRNGRLG